MSEALKEFSFDRKDIVEIENRKEVLQTESNNQMRYSMAGLITGTVFALMGTALFILGISGSVSWTAKGLGFESRLVDGSPGALLSIIGLIIVLGTRYNRVCK